MGAGPRTDGICGYSMDREDKAVMSQAVDLIPYKVDAAGISLAHRPRLYWIEWELLNMEGVEVRKASDPAWGCNHEVLLTATVDASAYVTPGWQLQHDQQRLPTFTTSRPSPQPGRRPAGLHQCSSAGRQRWTADSHRFPPYQYAQSNSLVRKRTQEYRVASLLEREVIMGMPANYTAPCLPMSTRQEHPSFTGRKCLVRPSCGVADWMLGLCPWPV